MIMIMIIMIIIIMIIIMILDYYCFLIRHYPKNASVQCEPRVFEKQTKEELWNSDGMKEFLDAVTPR